MLEMDVAADFGGFALEAKLSCETTGIIAFFGRSGAGKTSLVNMLAGLVRPARGRISVNGNVLFDSARGIDLPPESRRLGYVFQEGRLFPHMSVRKNLSYGYRRARAARPRIEFDRVVELLGLEELLDRRPGSLSGGEKQRVALGRALLANPRLLLMDEPLAALDQPRKEEVLPFIELLRDTLDIPIVYVSHSMAEIVRLADTLVLMSNGRVEAVGGVEDLTSRLDLRPLTGRYEAGAVVRAQVERHDEAFDLTELRFAGGILRVPRIEAAIGAEIRLRIRARDVALARERPQGLSILNILPCRVEAIGAEEGPQVDLRLDAGGAALWARITRHSVTELALVPGTPVFALIKAVAIDRTSLGRGSGAGRFLASGGAGSKRNSPQARDRRTISS
jgi:molybdate transport system ATP-binding protein